MQEDSVLEEGLCRLMKEHPKLDTTHMHITVQEAIAHLKGRADTEDEKKLAETLAASFPGIKGVKNELHVDIGIIHTITSIVSNLSANNEDELKHDKNS
jgi:osmotically-inducible protein OsmY